MYKNVNGKLIEMTEAEIAEEKQKIQIAKAEEKSRHLTAEEVTAMLIKQQINGLAVDNNTALRMVGFYPEWTSGTAYTVGYKVQYKGTLYKCIQAHTSQANWNPVDAPSLWAEVLAGQDGTAIGEWVQPDSTNPYMTGDKVTHNGKTWVSDVDNNVWEPGVYGWVEI